MTGFGSYAALAHKATILIKENLYAIGVPCDLITSKLITDIGHDRTTTYLDGRESNMGSSI